ncbi:pancreatic lipase-related protein 2-like isoform X2 [Phascolarctos cinereus]
MLQLWTITLLLLGTVRGKEICFERLGCFSNDKPWSGTLQRPFKVLPWSPEDINVRFLLYTKENPNNFQIILPYDPSNIEASNFKTDRKTHFVIHGFIDTGEESWLIDMCKKILQVENVNCFCVDWKKGSRARYVQAANNIRVVGAEIAYLINVLSTEFGYSPSNIHAIGHSLGAHVAGEAGKRLQGQIGRITGLDPAEPCFQNTPEEVRLDPSDAMFVDVIHSDAAPMLPNLGSRDFVACNHLRSYKYYSESILKPDGFLGYPCTSYELFNSGSDLSSIPQNDACFPCPSEGCPKMGHYADQFKGKTKALGQTFFLNTGDNNDFARWRYRISVTLSGGKKLTGYIRIAMYGSNGTSRQYDIFKGSLRPGASHKKEIDVDINVGKVERVKFLWNNNVINLFRPTLGASKATVQSGEDGTQYHFCSSDTVREDVLQTLSPC